MSDLDELKAEVAEMRKDLAMLSFVAGQTAGGLHTTRAALRDTVEAGLMIVKGELLSAQESYQAIRARLAAKSRDRAKAEPKPLSAFRQAQRELGREGDHSLSTLRDHETWKKAMAAAKKAGAIPPEDRYPDCQKCEDATIRRLGALMGPD